MVYRHLALTAAILALFASAAIAGSVFSTNGIGDPLVGGGTRVQGLGGGGFGLADSMGFNLDNPALGAFVPRTQIRLAGQLGIWQTQADGKSDVDEDYQWQNVYLFFPVYRTWRLGLGAEPKTSMNLHTIATHRAIFHDPGRADTSQILYEERDTWKGGGTDLRIDNSVKLSDRAAVGLSVSYLVMRNGLTHRLDLPPYDWENSATPYVDAEYTDHETFRGWSAMIGGYFAINPKLSVGVAFRPRFSGTWDYRLTKANSDTVIEQSRSGFRPGEINLGISYRLSDHLTGVFDVQTGQWDKGDLGYIADPDKTIKPVNPLFISAGVERPVGKPLVQTGMQMWGYRCGLYYRQQYWPERNGTAVNDIGATAGLSIPVASNTGMLHIALDGGMRGQDEKKLGAKETYLRTSIQLEISETWFQRTKPRAPK